MLYVCISFDYELFMGENYLDEKKVLIEPTRILSDMLAAEGISGSFFADVCCPMQYRKLEKTDFPMLFDSQIKDLTKAGQDVQLHIHPNWLKTTKVGRYVEFDNKYYRLHNWKDDNPNAIAEIIHNGIEYLYDLITPIDSKYKCVAFRAGGYCLQPEDCLAEILYKEGIRIDSSVCPGFSYSGYGMYYDYGSIPPCSNFFFSSEHSISTRIRKKIPNGIFEVPVGSYGTFPYRIIASRLNSKITNAAPRGHSMKIERKNNTEYSLMEKLRNILNAVNMVTFDFYNADSICYMIKRIYSEMNCRDSDVFISTISHPKELSKEHIENMRNVIRDIKKISGIRFVNMREIADICNLI